MASFVLIPGGWRGGWTFADFVARLRRAGHEAHAVTLSGLDDLPGRAAKAVNLDTHIDDVLELLSVEDLSEVILCAHSYGGMVATGVADRAPERPSSILTPSLPMTVNPGGTSPASTTGPLPFNAADMTG
jgi:pimeloyl-ACP methyl ester carboxylesterase